MGRFFKKTFPDGPILAAVMIVLTALVTYGLFIPRLGFYHDDWYMLWSAALRGDESLITLFSMDRPFMGMIYVVYYRLVGDSIPGWHILALLWRVAGAIAFYWILNLAWPRLKYLAIFTAVLFIVYPGFLAQPNAATKVNHLTGYAAALFSIGCTLRALKSEQRSQRLVFTSLGLVSTAFYLWIYEYMIGLEVMRLVLALWLVWQGRRGEFLRAVKKVILTYIPYLVVLGIFMYWRVFVFDSSRSATDMRGLIDSYQADFLGMALRLIFQVVQDFLSTTIFAWSVQPYTLFTRAGYVEILTALAVSAVVVLLNIWFFSTRNRYDVNEDEGHSPGWMVVIGCLITLGAVFPVVLSNRHLDLLDAYKGYGLHPSAGVMIIVLGIILMLRGNYRKYALVVLFALSILTQTMNAQRWGTFWDIQRNLWWQLTWRAPAIQENTLLMAYIPEGFALQQDYEVWGPVNLIYYPEPHVVPRIQAEVLNRDTIAQVYEGELTDPYVRDIFVPRDYGKLLLISQPTLQSCIHVIDGQMPAYSSSERPIVEKAGAYSNIDYIDPTGEPPTVPTAVFGEEPPREWCFYYQQASLARQTGDWQRIAQLYDESVNAGFRPADSSEYFVFVEGLVNSGRVEDASQIASNAIIYNQALRVSLCQSLENAVQYPDGYNYAQIYRLVCEQPPVE